MLRLFYLSTLLVLTTSFAQAQTYHAASYLERGNSYYAKGEMMSSTHEKHSIYRASDS